jgi:hypothetical protein
MIYRYEILLPNEGHKPITTKEIDVPEHSRVLSVAGQNGGVVVYFDVNPEFKNTETWIFKSVWTGVHLKENMAFAGTVVFDTDAEHLNYGMVYHIFYDR